MRQTITKEVAVRALGINVDAPECIIELDVQYEIIGATRDMPRHIDNLEFYLEGELFDYVTDQERANIGQDILDD